VVQMRVREHDCVEAFGRYRKLVPISETQLFEPLEQPAVEQDPLAVVFEEVLGPCDGACGTKKCEFRHVTNDDIRVLPDLSQEVPYAPRDATLSIWGSALLSHCLWRF
jgi:hypothetical protein